MAIVSFLIDLLYIDSAIDLYLQQTNLVTKYSGAVYILSTFHFSISNASEK